MEHQRFNIRVYGILERDGQVLISHERIADSVYAKFPGGGLEFGEGTIEAVTREFMEELGIAIQVDNHFYTTDFYLPSAFNSLDQILSIYYRVSTITDIELPFHQPTPSADDVMAVGQLFRWYPIAALMDGLVTLPADKVVAAMLNSASQNR